MSYTVSPGDRVLCVNAAPNHVTGEPVPLVADEIETKMRRVSAPKEKETVR